MAPRPALPGLSPISTVSPPDSPASIDRHGATSASEPSSPVEPSRSRLRQRHKTRSTASLADFGEHDTPYWVPAGNIPTPGPALPPRYTSQSEGDDSEAEMERRSPWLWDGYRPRLPRAIQTGAGTETEDAYDTSAVSIPFYLEMFVLILKFIKESLITQHSHYTVKCKQFYPFQPSHLPAPSSPLHRPRFPRLVLSPIFPAFRLCIPHPRPHRFFYCSIIRYRYPQCPSRPHNRPPSPLENLLRSNGRPRPSPCAPVDMLASNPHHPPRTLPFKETSSLLGRHRFHHMRQQKHPNVGLLQSRRHPFARTYSPRETQQSTAADVNASRSFTASE
jgi:hypothetical protein